MAPMKPSTVRRIAWSIGILSIALQVAGLAILFLDRHAILPSDATRWNLSNVLDQAGNAATSVLGIVLATRRPRNRLGWLFLAAGLGLGLGNFGGAYGVHALKADPGSLPAGRALAWVSNWIWTIPVTLLVFLLLLFPTGELPSRRWRPVAWGFGAFMTLVTLGAITFEAVNWSNPFGPNQRSTGLAAIAVIPFQVAILAIPAGLLASFTSLALRYKRSRGDERLQLKWFVTAAALVAVTFSLNIVWGTSTDDAWACSAEDPPLFDDPDNPTVFATVECAGNGRSFLQPHVHGVQWGAGAIGHAEWTGVPVKLVLEQSGLRAEAREVLFEGSDCGSESDHPQPMHFARSLPLAKAVHADTLLVYRMNGEPLEPIHGYPLRLFVPGWYGVASVKWLKRIEVLDRPFQGYFQTKKYTIQRPAAQGQETVIVGPMAVKAEIIRPQAGAALGLGTNRLFGIAWAGEDAVARVEVADRPRAHAFV